ncbi:hypothetical protein [Moorena sp. SIO4A5]|nr:hypothetical protein [Moorena sp. SIO4A5]
MVLQGRIILSYPENQGSPVPEAPLATLACSQFPTVRLTRN